MSTYENAYCKSLGRDITAKEANKYTLNGKINEDEKLYCSDNCSLILTCINRTVDYHTNALKISPYYANRIHGQKHSHDCNRKNEFLKTNKKGKIKNSFYYFDDDQKK